MLLLIFVATAHGQGYPSKPVRMVVGFVPGGGADVTARIFGPKLAEALAQPVVIENRPGAGSSLATEKVAASPPDGYTLLLMASSGVLQAQLRTHLPYDVQRDLVPVSLVATGTFVLVIHPSVPARSAKELIALARARPGKLNYSSAGVGTASHLAGELFNSTAKLNLVHVPFKGGAESVVAIASGQIEMSFPTITAALPLLDAGRLKPLAITSAKRASLLPAVPTLNESVMPGYDHSIWYGVMAPAGVARDIVARLATAIGKVMSTAEIRNALNKQGLEPATSTPEQFTAFLQREMALNAKLITITGAKAD
jgi:tripartite-type tricarboxylate transporter receptor subunit TctC